MVIVLRRCQKCAQKEKALLMFEDAAMRRAVRARSGVARIALNCRFKRR